MWLIIAGKSTQQGQCGSRDHWMGGWSAAADMWQQALRPGPTCRSSLVLTLGNCGVGFSRATLQGLAAASAGP